MITHGYIQVPAINALRAAKKYNAGVASHPSVTQEDKIQARSFIQAFSILPENRLVLININSPLIYHLQNENILQE